jgi:ferritin-like metal-binding protein YciE
MADLNERDAKLVQLLSEAYGKEKQLETDLEAHIAMTSKAPYKKRLRRHLQETKRHAREVERRIKQLGGDANGALQAAETVVGKAKAVARGPLHMVRGTGEDELLLKNARTEYSEEHHEIAGYASIEALAETVGDRETAKLARSIRRDEERMASYLARLIPQLARAVARAEIPSAQRNGAARRRSRSTSARRSRGGSSGSRSASNKRGSTRRSSSRSGGGSTRSRTRARSASRS